MNVGKIINVRLSFLNLKADKRKRKAIKKKEATQEVRERRKQRKE